MALSQVGKTGWQEFTNECIHCAACFTQVLGHLDTYYRAVFAAHPMLKGVQGYASQTGMGPSSTCRWHRGRE